MNKLTRRKQRVIKNKNIDRPKGRGNTHLPASRGIKIYNSVTFAHRLKPQNPDTRYLHVH